MVTTLDIGVAWVRLREEAAEFEEFSRKQENRARQAQKPLNLRPVLLFLQHNTQWGLEQAYKRMLNHKGKIKKGPDKGRDTVLDVMLVHIPTRVSSVFIAALTYVYRCHGANADDVEGPDGHIEAIKKAVPGIEVLHCKIWRNEL